MGLKEISFVALRRNVGLVLRNDIPAVCVCVLRRLLFFPRSTGKLKLTQDFELEVFRPNFYLHISRVGLSQILSQ